MNQREKEYESLYKYQFMLSQTAHKAQDLAAIDAAKAELNNAWQTASAQMYQQTGAQPGAGAGFQGGPQQPGAGSSSANNENVQDADFEEEK